MTDEAKPDVAESAEADPQTPIDEIFNPEVTESEAKPDETAAEPEAEDESPEGKAKPDADESEADADAKDDRNVPLKALHESRDKIKTLEEELASIRAQLADKAAKPDETEEDEPLLDADFDPFAEDAPQKLNASLSKIRADLKVEKDEITAELNAVRRERQLLTIERTKTRMRGEHDNFDNAFDAFIEAVKTDPELAQTVPNDPEKAVERIYRKGADILLVGKDGSVADLLAKREKAAAEKAVEEYRKEQEQLGHREKRRGVAKSITDGAASSESVDDVGTHTPVDEMLLG